MRQAVLNLYGKGWIAGHYEFGSDRLPLSHAQSMERDEDIDEIPSVGEVDS